MTTASLSSTSTLAGLQHLLSWPFQQPRWQEKLLLGVLFTVVGFAIPLLPTLVVMGYFAEVSRQAISAGELRLPEWTQWDRLLRDGLRLFGVGLILTLPSLAVMFLSFGLMFGTSAFAGLIETGGEDAILRFMWVPLAGALGGIALMGVAILLAMVTGLILPPASMHVIATGDFMAAFRYREWWPILRANAAGFLWAYLLVFGITMVFYFAVQVLYVTVVLCCLLPFVAVGFSIYSYLVYHAAFGLAYRAGAEKLAPAPAPH